MEIGEGAGEGEVEGGKSKWDITSNLIQGERRKHLDTVQE